MGYKRKRSSSYPGSGKRRKAGRSFSRRRRTFRRKKKGRKNLAHSTSSRAVSNARSCVNIKSLGLPRSLIVRFPYREYVKLTTGALGVGDSYQFRLMSPYDPNLTGVGSQPRYWDQLVSSELYKRYLVYRCDYVVTFRNQYTGDCQVGVAIRNYSNNIFDLMTPQSMFYHSELGNTAVRQLNGTTFGGGANRTTFSGSINCARILGITKTKLYAEADYSAEYNTNPARDLYLNVGVTDDPSDTGTSGINVDVEVSLVYYCKLFSLFDAVAQS